MRVFKNKAFTRFTRKNDISDRELCVVIENAERGLVDADLGGGVIKQRIARKGSGKSGGFRTIILFRARERAIFVHGFAKSELGNIRTDELAVLKKLATEMLAYREEAMDKALASGSLIEVKCHGETIS